MTDPSFRDFVLDQLQHLDDIECRAMFGGYGLYATGVFFGILSDGRLYFKTDQSSREMYIHKGMEPFRPNPKQTLKNYYEVPVEILEDHQQLTLWARQAIHCQLANNNRKTKPRQSSSRKT